jgi:hypothetical protein
MLRDFEYTVGIIRLNILAGVFLVYRAGGYSENKLRC